MRGATLQLHTGTERISGGICKMQLGKRITVAVSGSNDFPLFSEEFDIDPKSGGLSYGQQTALIRQAAQARDLHPFNALVH